MKEALGFPNQSPTAEILSIRDAQLNRMQQLVRDAIPIELEFGQLIPEELRPAADKLRLAPLMSLMYQHNLWGSSLPLPVHIRLQIHWGIQSKARLPSFGQGPQAETHSDKALMLKPKSLKIIELSDASRFSERAAKSGYKNAHLVWADAMEQQKKGWLSQSPPLFGRGPLRAYWP